MATPDDFRTTHTGDLLKPFSGRAGDVIDRGKILSERAPSEEVKFRLSDMAKGRFLFTLGPVYVGARVNFDLITQFGVDMSIPEQDLQLITCRLNDRILVGGLGEWEYTAQCFPEQGETLFTKYILQTVFTRNNVKPKQYWRINARELKILPPGEFARVRLVVFVPTGADYRIEPVVTEEGTVGFVKEPAEDWVVKQAMTYFSL